MIETLLICLLVAQLPMTLLGTLMFFHIMRAQNAPTDTSNRINKIRLIWFALTREDLFAGWFEWMKRDEMDNLK